MHFKSKSSSKNQTVLSLRSIVKTAGGLAFFVNPILQMARAQTGTAHASRLFVFSHLYGHCQSQMPQTYGTDYTFSPMLAGLNSIKPDLNIFSKVTMKPLADKLPADNNGHGPGLRCSLTGFMSPQNEKQTAVDASVEVYLANKFGTNTSSKYLILADRDNGMSYLPQGNKNPANTNPTLVFNTLFGNFVPPSDGGGNTEAMELLRLRKQSVLDYITKDLSSLKSKVSSSEYSKIDLHLEGIRELERQLELSTSVAASADYCQPPKVLPDMGPVDRDDTKLNLMFEIAYHAMACGLTKFVHLQTGTENYLDFISGVSHGHHDLSHHGKDADKLAQYIKVCEWRANFFAKCVNRFKSTTEGTGNMLDKTLCLWASDMGSGGGHVGLNMNYMLAGNAGGKFKTGQHINMMGASHHKVLTTICHGLGDPISIYGDVTGDAGPIDSSFA